MSSFTFLYFPVFSLLPEETCFSLYDKKAYRVLCRTNSVLSCITHCGISGHRQRLVGLLNGVARDGTSAASRLSIPLSDRWQLVLLCGGCPAAECSVMNKFGNVKLHFQRSWKPNGLEKRFGSIRENCT